MPEVPPLPSWVYPWLPLAPVVLLLRPAPGRASFTFSPMVLLSLLVPDDAPAVGKTRFTDHTHHWTMQQATDETWAAQLPSMPGQTHECQLMRSRRPCMCVPMQIACPSPVP